jgi:hypothetical protein
VIHLLSFTVNAASEQLDNVEGQENEVERGG